MSNLILAQALAQGQEKWERSEREVERIRMRESTFVRKRKLGAKRILALLLMRVYLCTQLHLDSFFAFIEELPVSKQAFSKARQDLNPEYVREFFEMTVQIAVEEDRARFKGMRVLAFDGTRIALENSEELKAAYGCAGGAATALASMVVGVYNDCVYDCRVGRYDDNERNLASQNIDQLKKMGLEGSLLLGDRAYPSAALMSHILDSGFHFLMRVRRKFNCDADAVNLDGIISISNGGVAFDVRVVKITLPSGEIETLLTSLSNACATTQEVGELYRLRWAVETAYNTLKSKLQLENFSGRTQVTFLQDLYATLYICNLSAFAAMDANAIIELHDASRNLKYPRKASRNRSIAKVREVFIRALCETDTVARDVLLQRAVNSIALYPISIVHDRNPERSTPRKKPFHSAYKSVL